MLQRLRRHGDIVKRTVGGYFNVQGRADDTMNLGGIKVLHCMYVHSFDRVGTFLKLSFSVSLLYRRRVLLRSNVCVIKPMNASLRLLQLA